MTPQFPAVAEPVRFRPSMQTGLPAVDRQHATLIDELNRLIADESAGLGSALFSEVLSRLGLELREHFTFEEGELFALGVPQHEIDAHLADHRTILEDYAALNFELMTRTPLTRHDTLLRIRGWVLDHILGFDLRMRDYLPSPGQGQRASLTRG